MNPTRANRNSNIHQRGAFARIVRSGIPFVFALGFVSGSVYAADPKIIAFWPPAGNEGDVIMISGAGFDPVPANNEVKFGGPKGEVISVTKTSMQVVVPHAAASGPVTLKVHDKVAASRSKFKVGNGKNGS